jgi:hypothetical protein
MVQNEQLRPCMQVAKTREEHRICTADPLLIILSNRRLPERLGV